MNTNINNKKFKLVPLRNQPMQAFACKRECDKESRKDSDREREGGEKERGTQRGPETTTERKGGGWGGPGDGRGGGREKKKVMTIPRLIRSRFLCLFVCLLFLTTLKKTRWTFLSLNLTSC